MIPVSFAKTVPVLFFNAGVVIVPEDVSPVADPLNVESSVIALMSASAWPVKAEPLNVAAADVTENEAIGRTSPAPLNVASAVVTVNSAVAPDTDSSNIDHGLEPNCVSSESLSARSNTAVKYSLLTRSEAPTREHSSMFAPVSGVPP